MFLKCNNELSLWSLNLPPYSIPLKQVKFIEVNDFFQILVPRTSCSHPTSSSVSSHSTNQRRDLTPCDWREEGRAECQPSCLQDSWGKRLHQRALAGGVAGSCSAGLTIAPQDRKPLLARYRCYSESPKPLQCFLLVSVLLRRRLGAGPWARRVFVWGLTSTAAPLGDSSH